MNRAAICCHQTFATKNVPRIFSPVWAKQFQMPQYLFKKHFLSEEDISDTVALKGKIDRIDICRDGDKSYLRIIDYKTGKTVFDIKNIYNG